MKTLYDLLEIDPRATQAQIEQGYKRRLDHYLDRRGVGKPDEATRRMQQVREAYLLLCSPQRRQAYDQQLRLYEKARTHIVSRGNRKFIVLLMVIMVAVVVGVTMRKAGHIGANPRAQEMLEQSMATGTAAQLPDPEHRKNQLKLVDQQVARSN